MFGNTRGGNTASAASGRASGRGMFSVIGPDMAITGNVAATADLHVDGRIAGDVACGTLIQGADSQITGNVAAETVRLAGTIEGAVRAKQVTIEPTARITGDVEYDSITIELGGRVEGRLTHLGEATLHAVPALPRLANEQAA